jgi:hypothetical protein
VPAKLGIVSEGSSLVVITVNPVNLTSIVGIRSVPTTMFPKPGPIGVGIPVVGESK